MKSKYIYLSLLVTVLIAGGYFLYQQFFTDRQNSVWSFVPANAVFVYETEKVPDAWQSLEEQPLGQILQDLPHWQRLNQYRQLLDTATAGKLESFLTGRHMLSSLHITGNNSFDYLFYLPLKAGNDKEVLKALKGAFQEDSAYQYSVRNFHSHQIEEFTHLPSRQSFSWIIQQGYLVGSLTPFLVEDVIRLLGEEKEGAGFKSQHSALFQMNQTDADEGNLYVNGKTFGAFLNLFLKENHFQESFPLASKLDIGVTKEGVLLNGYTAPKAGGTAPYLYSLLNEAPQTMGFGNLVPLRTAVIKFLGFGNGKEWHHKLIEMGGVPKWQELIKAQPEAVVLPALLGKRVGLAEIPHQQGENSYLLYLHTPEAEKASENLRQLAAQMGQASGDSLFQEEFSGYTITQLPYPDFPEAFLGSAFTGFEECFFLQLNDYLVFGNNIQELKSMLLDVESDNTWQKSVPIYQFMDKINQEVNFGLYVNNERIWKKLLGSTEPGWGNYLEQYGPYLRQFNMLALQLSALDDLFYTNFFLQAVPQKVQDLRQLRFSILHETELRAPAATRPVLLENRQQKKKEMLVQDTLNILYLLDAQGDVQKTDSLSSPLLNPVFKLDPRKNGRQEYLAAGKNALYLYDPSFTIRRGFPVSVPQGAQLQWVNVIDYNGSKMYRILGAARSGDIFMFDLEGNNLEGWQPRKMNGALSAAPGHLRVRGKDVIYAFQKDGKVHMLNRRGNSYDGFPIDLKDSLLGQVFIKPGSDFKSTEFKTVTKGGELVSFNLNGKVTHRTQLFKPEVNSAFMLVPEHQQSSYLIARQSNNRLSLLDAKGSLLFEKDYLGAANVLIQYYHFGADKELITVTDPVEEFTFLYDMEGNLLNFEPLNSCCPLEVQLDEGSGGYRIYKSYENRVSVLKGVE